jgi:hypothetical protein
VIKEAIECVVLVLARSLYLLPWALFTIRILVKHFRARAGEFVLIERGETIKLAKQTWNMELILFLNSILGHLDILYAAFYAFDCFPI